MSCKLIPPILLLLFVVTKASFNASAICGLLTNGTRIKDPRACNVWITCIEGIPYNGTCDGDLFYDRNTYSCVSTSHTKCVSSNPCATLDGASGFTADPTSCNSYYYCDMDVGTRGECGTGYNFDPNRTECIRSYPCVSKMNPDSYCNILPDGVFIKNLLNCNGYQLCWKGQVLNLTCPSGYYYNALRGDCDYMNDVKCAESSNSGSIPPTVSPSEFCGNNTGIFVSDRKSCNGYYYCKSSSNSDTGIALRHGTCPNGRFFTPANGGECVARIDIACEYNRCVGLASDRIMLVNKTDDGCHGYTICQDNVPIGNGTCPSDGYFNELTQLCTNETIMFPACAPSIPTATTQDNTTEVF